MSTKKPVPVKSKMADVSSKGRKVPKKVPTKKAKAKKSRAESEAEAEETSEEKAQNEAIESEKVVSMLRCVRTTVKLCSDRYVPQIQKVTQAFIEKEITEEQALVGLNHLLQKTVEAGKKAA